MITDNLIINIHLTVIFVKKITGSGISINRHTKLKTLLVLYYKQMTLVGIEMKARCCFIMKIPSSYYYSISCIYHCGIALLMQEHPIMLISAIPLYHKRVLYFL